MYNIFVFDMNYTFLHSNVIFEKRKMGFYDSNNKLVISQPIKQEYDS